jgi:hypothetical protein
MRLEEITEKRASEKTLYVCRPLLNADDLKAWAKDQGFETCVPDDMMHVTVIHSKREVKWTEKPLKDEVECEPDKDHPRSLQKFGEKKDIVVLTFYSKNLLYRHETFMDMGCSFDFPDYKAHVTITYDGKDVDIAGMEPYDGDLIFGPEIFEEISEDFKTSFEEESLD